MKGNAYGILMRKQEGRRWPIKPRHRYDGNIKMDSKEIGWEDVDWFDLSQDRKHCSETSGSAIC